MKAYSRSVYYYETDCMKFFHNSNYLRIFEEARIDHMLQSGVSYYEMEKQGIMIPQIEAYVKYRNNMQYGDTFEIEVTLEKMTGARIRYSYHVTVPERGAVIADGWTEHCFVDMTNNLPVNLQRRLPDTYDSLTKAL